VGGRSQAAIQSAVTRLREETAQVNKEIKRLMDMKRDVLEIIAEIDDIEIRLIIEKRHLLYQLLSEISRELDKGERWTKVLYKRGLRIVRQIIQEREETKKTEMEGKNLKSCQTMCTDVSRCERHFCDIILSTNWVKNHPAG
jgi:hypothetical protein